MARKSRKQARVTATVDLGESLAKAIEDQAQKERRKRAAMCRILLEEALIARGVLRAEAA